MRGGRRGARGVEHGAWGIAHSVRREVFGGRDHITQRFLLSLTIFIYLFSFPETMNNSGRSCNA